jgi:hypothetical protein
MAPWLAPWRLSGFRENLRVGFFIMRIESASGMIHAVTGSHVHLEIFDQGIDQYYTDQFPQEVRENLPIGVTLRLRLLMDTKYNELIQILSMEQVGPEELPGELKVYLEPA